MFVCAILLAGCAGFWDPPSSTSTTTTPTTLSSGAFYVLDQKAMRIAAYTISSGTLEQLSGSPYALAGAPFCMAVAPGGGFLYVSIAGAGIYLFTIGSNGTLTAGNSGGTISGDIPLTMQIDPSGSWLVEAYDTASGGLQVNAIPITTRGTLDSSRTEQVPSNLPSFTNASANGIAISPSVQNVGQYVFIAAGEAGTVVISYSAGSASPLASSSAVTITPLHSIGSALSVAVDPRDRLFYIGETLANSGTSGGLRAFNYSSLGGALTQASGSPIASGGLSPSAILPIASGGYVYVANGQGETGAGNVAWFPITASGTTYSIASGSTIASGIFPVGLAEDSEDNFVLAVSTGGATSSGNPDLEAYTMSSGTLSSALTSATGSDPVGAIAVAALP